MYNLFLDDERFPQTAIKLVTENVELYSDDRNWVIVRNFDEFVSEIKEMGMPNMISFDHDLADIKYKNGVMSFSYLEKTGFDCAKWLVNYCMDNNVTLPNYQVHSANPIGKQNIESYLMNYLKSIKK